MVERQTLTFVDGDGPRQFQRILHESAQHFLFDVVCFRIQNVACVAPFCPLDADCFSVGSQFYVNRVVNSHDFRKRAVHVAVFG